MYNHTVCDTKCNTMFIFGASETIIDGIITIIIVIGGVALIIRDIDACTPESDTVILYLKRWKTVSIFLGNTAQLLIFIISHDSDTSIIAVTSTVD